ncbi:MMPL family transporter [Saccharothrix violaceirubra]|uniref:RND superfamily putative drug exporter n=1 Tax=Saccharothrix violaceirubra TaxID=413306 RepID=A0A7W7WWK5_9PSEU|nr:MMPL family transporter [Saccharothrix violaceirubra]MBB4966440.1 RND superfamily putative drug exporter [Saccharothrix violaceirubra]
MPAPRLGSWLALLCWLALLAPLWSLAGRIDEVERNDRTAWLPADAESTAVIRLVEEFRSGADLAVAVVYHRDGGLTDVDLAAIGRHAAGFRALADAEARPVPDRETRPEAVHVVVPAGGDDVAGLPAEVRAIRDIAADRPDGLAVHVTGPGAVLAAQTDAFAGIDTTLLVAALVVVIAVLLGTYRSPVLWVLPVVAAGVALVVSRGLVHVIASSTDLIVTAQGVAILMVLVFGAGTDYALLLVARYREECRGHPERRTAMVHAVRRTAPAVAASAATVVASMLCLSFADTTSTAGLGPIAAIGISVALLSMLTLLPALLLLAGDRVFWPHRPEQREPGWWDRVGTRVARHPRRVWLVAVLGLVAMAAGVTSLRTAVPPDADLFTGRPDFVVGQEVLDRHFPASAASPLLIVVPAGHADEVRARLSGVPGIESTSDSEVRGNLAYVEAFLRAAPDSAEAQTVVRAAREALRGTDAKVGGETATRVDTRDRDVRDRDVVIPLVTLVVFLILVLLLRALVAATLLVASVVLSFLAALGLAATVFEATVVPYPLYVFVFLVALGIDYNIFLMTRVHEEACRSGTRAGVLTGLAATGGVISSAGLVLAGTFAVLVTLPLVFMVHLGLTVAVGVLIDTFVVRTVLVTALALDLDRWFWWPARVGPSTPARATVGG